MARRFPPSEVVVLTSAGPSGAEGRAAVEEFDAAQPYPVVRERARWLLPTPRTAATARALVARYCCDRVWFGAAAPLGLLAGPLGLPSVATTHGHEMWWAAVPGARHVLRHIGDGCDTVTWLAPHTRARIARGLRPGTRLEQLAPGVDAELFAPPSGEVRDEARRRFGLGARPVVLSVSRLVPRKGQDVLIRALPRVRAAVPGATLLIVGAGRHERRLRRLARGTRGLPPGAVVFAGGLPHTALPPCYAAADVFAMPCRDRLLGLESEGLGIVFLEAAAAGLPVLAGRSGGAPATVRDGETGHVVDGRDVRAVADRLVELLTAPGAMGEKGRAWAADEWSWDASARRLRALLSRTFEA